MKWTMAVIGLLCAGCATTQAPNHTATERARLLATDAAFSQTSEKDGVRAAFAAFAANEATFMPMGQPLVVGKTEIVEHLSKFPPGVIKWKALGADVAASGELGYTWGTFEFAMKGEQGTIDQHYGKYVTVWRRQPDGQWKVIVDVSNASPPPEEDEANEQ